MLINILLKIILNEVKVYMDLMYIQDNKLICVTFKRAFKHLTYFYSFIKSDERKKKLF